MTSVWPALCPPWKRTTTSARLLSQSTSLPLPSSPHWAPITVTFAKGRSPFLGGGQTANPQTVAPYRAGIAACNLLIPLIWQFRDNGACGCGGHEFEGSQQIAQMVPDPPEPRGAHANRQQDF